MAKVIITGGTGLIGRRLASLLTEKGWEVAILCRHPKRPGEYKWDLATNFIDEKIWEGATAIIHLAGAPVLDERWTEKRKKEIIDSRVQSTALLHAHLSKTTHSVTTFIGASAVGFYGDRQEEILTETCSHGEGFLADVCRQWEAAEDTISTLGIPVSKIRIGIVLSKESGALPKMALPVKLGIGAYIGNGNQWVPWIHLDDMCALFIHLLEHPALHGVYNACAPDIRTNKQLTEAIAHALHRPFIPAPVPEFLLNILIGEAASTLLMSNHCSCEKISDTGFSFQFPTLEKALENIYGK